MNVPTVSVILPTLNRCALLRRSMASVLTQNYRDLELIVVDDGSTEDVRNAAMQFNDPRVRYVRRDVRGGPAAARNTGVTEANAAYLAFQDSDDEWLPDKLSRQVEALRDAGPECMAICGLIRGSGRRVRRYPSPALRPGGVLTQEQVLGYPFAYTQSWLVPRWAVKAAGGFDESLRVWDDWELLIRLSARLRIRLLADTLVIAPASPDSISAERERFIRDMEYILHKHAQQLRLYPRALAQLRYTQGRLLGSAGHHREARAAFTGALRARPNHWRAAALLAASLAGPAGLQRLLRMISDRRLRTVQSCADSRPTDPL